MNAISFVWNTVTAMWEERFRRLNEWRKINGHCAVPIAQGELGTWVSKQRQLRKRGKLSKEKIAALNSLNFTWSTAEADWEEKFKRLCAWTRQRGHASVPFNEGELGWWVNTQRQCKRKGKLSPFREARLESLGFVWNPSNSRSRTSSSTAQAAAAKALSAAVISPMDTFVSSTADKCGPLFASEDDVDELLNLFTTSEYPPQLPDVKSGYELLQEAPSPVSPIAEPLPTETAPQPTVSEPLASPPPAFLSQNLWSPTIISSPMHDSNFSGLGMAQMMHMPPLQLDDPQHVFEASFEGPTDVLEQILARDDVGIMDTNAIAALTCHEIL